MTQSVKIISQALPLVAALSRFWPFRRKQLAAELTAQLENAQSQFDVLCTTNQQLTAQCHEQKDDIRSLQSQNDSLAGQLRTEISNLTSVSAALTESQSSVAGLEAQYQQQLLKIAALESVVIEQKSNVQNLQTAHQQLLVQSVGQAALIESLTQQLHIETTNLRAMSETLAQEKSKLQNAMNAFTQAKAECKALEERQAQALLQITELESFLEEHKSQLLSKEQSVNLLESQTEQLKALHQHLESNYQDINQQHLSLTEKFRLVSRVLAQQPPRNDALDALTSLIDNDFMDFANRESSLADEAQAILAMQALLAELRMVNNFPSIAGKTLLSIGGGFSSGKSAFLNSFLKDRGVQLATGINPVTVVPSYVVCADETKIRGYSYNGGSIELEKHLYASLSHEYVKTFGFDLRRILPFISLSVSMETELFANLCIIDTPGYNPGTFGGSEASDRATASSLIEQASALIWVIGLDPAGTIAESDIAFIEATPFRDQSLYIVLNKADVKSEADIELIMEQVADDLDFAGIGFAGMCAYSSIRTKEYRTTGQTLSDFLRKINRQVDVVGHIEKKLDDVFNKYQQAIQADIEQLECQARQFNDFKLDALEIGGTTLFDRIEQALPMYEQMFDSSKLKQLLAECETLRQKLKQAAAVAIT